MLLQSLKQLLRGLQAEKMRQWKRRVSVGDLLIDRDEIAREYGFGEGTTCYDNVLIIGDVKVGCNTWIGPNVILDGSGGGLTIGDWCMVSSGVQIYTHDNVSRCTTLGIAAVDTAPTRIGSGVYIGPNSVIAMGVTVGDRAIIGAMSFVNRDIPDRSKAFGCPAKIAQ